jgi:hypothetical protein
VRESERGRERVKEASEKKGERERVKGGERE